jgi:uncharacterized repeat protein (TIGR02543 family)
MNIHRKFALVFTIILSFSVALTSLSVGAILNSAKPANAAAGQIEIWDGSVASGFAGGTGTVNDPYLISNGAQLAYLAQEANKKANNQFNNSKLNYKMTGDIYLNDTTNWESWTASTPNLNNWEPIGNNFASSYTSNPHGVFEGNGFAVYGLYCVPTTQKAAGLFGYVSATITNGSLDIRNLGVQGFVTNSGYSSSGGILGGCSNLNVTIQNCWSQVHFGYTKYTGGVVGSLGVSGKVINCLSLSTIPYSTETTTGAVVGFLTGELLYCSFGLTNENLKICGQDSFLGNVKDCSMFDENGDLVTPVVVNGQTCTTVSEALNAWVDSNPEGEFAYWDTEDFTVEQTFIPPSEWSYFSVAFNSMGGTEIENASVRIGKTITKPTDPEKTGHDFGGWYTEQSCATPWIFSTAITENMELFAKWIPHLFTVKFYSEGDELTDLELENVAYNSKILKPVFANGDENLKIAGWYTDGVNFAGSTAWDFTTNTVTENIELHALWIVKALCSITFNTNGGTPVDNPTCLEDDRVAERITTKDGYIFLGWYTDEQCTNQFNFQTPITADLELWAKWSIIPTEPVTPTDPNTPTNQTTTGEQSDKNNTPMIIGAIIAVISLLIGAGISTYIFLKRKKEIK